MGKGKGGRTPNDDRSDSKNPNNLEYKGEETEEEG